jgi:hypothetical protein
MLRLRAAGVDIQNPVTNVDLYNHWKRAITPELPILSKREVTSALIELSGILTIQRERSAADLAAKQNIIVAPKPKLVVSPRVSKILTADIDISSAEFLLTREWRYLRYKILKKFGASCQCCGRSPKTHHIIINVDHIKPRRKYPELALDENNLQILCEDCNAGKGNWDETDWRPDAAHA